MALQLIQGGAEPIQIIVATFIMNFRHFLMSSHLSAILPAKEKPWLLPFLSFGITDESFAYLSTSHASKEVDFILGLEYSAYVSWVGGTVTVIYLVIYYLLSFKPVWDWHFTLFFIALLVPEAKRSLSGGNNCCNRRINAFMSCLAQNFFSGVEYNSSHSNSRKHWSLDNR